MAAGDRIVAAYEVVPGVGPAEREIGAEQRLPRCFRCPGPDRAGLAHGATNASGMAYERQR